MQVSFSISIAANTTDQNVLETLGLRVRTVPQSKALVAIQLFATGSATGLQHAFFVGNDNPIETSVVNAQNRVPVVPDDAVNTETIEAVGGEQLQLQVTNTTGGALTYFGTLEIQDVV